MARAPTAGPRPSAPPRARRAPPRARRPVSVMCRSLPDPGQSLVGRRARAGARSPGDAASHARVPLTGSARARRHHSGPQPGASRRSACVAASCCSVSMTAVAGALPQHARRRGTASHGRTKTMWPRPSRCCPAPPHVRHGTGARVEHAPAVTHRQDIRRWTSHWREAPVQDVGQRRLTSRWMSAPARDGAPARHGLAEDVDEQIAERRRLSALHRQRESNPREGRVGARRAGGAAPEASQVRRRPGPPGSRECLGDRLRSARRASRCRDSGLDATRRARRRYARRTCASEASRSSPSHS